MEVNTEEASDFFGQVLDPAAVLSKERDGNVSIIQPDLSRVGKFWYKSFLRRYPSISAIYSRALDDDRARNNNPKVLEEYFKILKEMLFKYNIKPHNISS